MKTADVKTLKAPPEFLFWCDLETTGLDERAHEILELAYVVTTFAFPWRELSRRSYLVSGPGRIALLRGEVDERVLEMHRDSGLTADLADPERMTTLARIEADLLALTSEWPPNRVPFAGFSADFDRRFLRRHMPMFEARLSYRTFDASVLLMASRSLGFTVDGDVPDAAHRAMDDTLAAIELGRRYLGSIAGARDFIFDCLDRKGAGVSDG